MREITNTGIGRPKTLITSQKGSNLAQFYWKVVFFVATFVIGKSRRYFVMTGTGERGKPSEL